MPTRAKPTLALPALVVFTLLNCTVHPHKEAVTTMQNPAQRELTIDEQMRVTQDEKLQAMLLRFRDTHQKEGERLTVTEHPDHYEIVVHRESSGGYTGGAEQYLLDKTTGEWKMGWHEHPMELPEIENAGEGAE